MSAASVATDCAVVSASSYAAIASRVTTSSFIPKDKLSRRAFAIAVMANVVLGSRTMRYGVEFSLALPL